MKKYLSHRNFLFLVLGLSLPLIALSCGSGDKNQDLIREQPSDGGAGGEGSANGEGAAAGDGTGGGDGECSPGDEGCECLGDGKCDDELTCRADECVDTRMKTPADCTRGEEGCICYGNSTCDKGLICSMDICVDEDVPDGPDDLIPGSCQGEPLVIEDAQIKSIQPPAGVQVAFRVRDCLGRGVTCLPEGAVTILNGETGKEFNASTEGGSRSGAGLPSELDLYALLILDFSSSIFSVDAQNEVVAGAKAYVNATVRALPEGLKQKVAILPFGSTQNTELAIDFTSDADALDTAIDGLASTDRGSTNLYGAYRLGLELLSAAGTGTAFEEKFAVLMTDGAHEAGDKVNQRQLALDAKAASAATICTIGIEGDYQPDEIEELATGPSLADSSACFFQGVTVDELVSTFESISEQAESMARSKYQVGICTPVELGTPELTVVIEIEGSRGSVTLPPH